MSYLGNDCDDTNTSLIPGSMRCSSATDYQICQAGDWSIKTACPLQQRCAAQPNGTGVCI